MAGPYGRTALIALLGVSCGYSRPPAVSGDAVGGDGGADANSPPPAPALVVLAGQLGGPGHRDGVGSAARVTPNRVCADGAGNVYVTSGSTIAKLALDTNTVTTIAGQFGATGTADGDGSAARFMAPNGIVYDGAGALYVADTTAATIRKIVLATNTVSTFVGTAGATGSADGVGSFARFHAPTALATDGAGALYLTDQANNAVRKIVIATATVSTLAGSDAPGTSSDVDATGSAARFNNTFGVAANGGLVFASDLFSIRQIVASTGAVTTLAGTGTSGSADGSGSAASFTVPLGISSDGGSYLYVVDASYNNTIRRVSTSTGAVATLAGEAGGFGASDGFGSAAQFENPRDVLAYNTTTLYVADGAGTIRKIDTSSRQVSTIVGLPPAFGEVDGSASTARFDEPDTAGVDLAGNVYVFDGNRTIRAIDSTGAVTTFAGLADMAGSADGDRLHATLGLIDGIVVAPTGVVFVSDDQCIRAITPAGDVTTIAGLCGTEESTDGTGSAARFFRTQGLALDATGKLYVATSGDNRVRVVDPTTGAVTTLAGSNNSCTQPDTDGPPASATFCEPWGVAAGSDGNLYVAERSGAAIRRVAIATGDVTTIAGGSGYVDGALADARFGELAAITIDTAGVLYVTDATNHVIRKVDIANDAVSTVVGTPAIQAVAPGPLPAALNTPAGLAITPSGHLVIVDSVENAVLEVR